VTASTDFIAAMKTHPESLDYKEVQVYFRQKALAPYCLLSEEELNNIKFV
jgi:hypothetical protein